MRRRRRNRGNGYLRPRGLGTHGRQPRSVRSGLHEEQGQGRLHRERCAHGHVHGPTLDVPQRGEGGPGGHDPRRGHGEERRAHTPDPGRGRQGRPGGLPSSQGAHRRGGRRRAGGAACP